MKSFLFVLVCCMSFLYISCEKESEATLSYTEDISPLLTSCANLYCHGGASYAPNMQTYTDIVAVANSGKMIPALRHEEGVSPMPKSQDKMSEADISKIETWISQGMPE